MKLRTALTVGTTLIVLGALAVLGGTALVYSGIYPISATEPHAPFVQALLSTVMRQSVKHHAAGIEPEVSFEPAVLRRGLELYRHHCVACHGAPGQGRARMGIGVNPNPPQLVTAANDWSAGEIYWIVANGLKMAGMPAFGLAEEPIDLWAITSFVVRMSTLAPAEYRALVAEVEGKTAGEQPAPWRPSELGWAELARAGDARRGRAHIVRFGCGACHVIPGLPGATGLVGPPLGGWARRHYVGGRAVNVPSVLTRWLMRPQEIDPETTMPNLDVPRGAAWDIAAYLYTLE